MECTGISETCDLVAHLLRVLRMLLKVDILVERGNGEITYERDGRDSGK
jgi:hypothetical protein